MTTVTAATSAASSAAIGSTASAPAANLKRGATGAAVQQLQLALSDLGFRPGPADGQFGPMTEAALKAFQRSKRLVADGRYGPRTRAALRAALAPKPRSGTLRRGASGPAVRTLQQSLAKLGHNPGPADGQFGPKTEAALKSFQRKKGLAADGVFGPKTKAAMVAALKPAPAPTAAPAVNMKRGATGPAVKQLQRALAKVGHNPGPVDGQFGAMTENALRRFQSAYGLSVDGLYGPRSRAALQRALRGEGPVVRPPPNPGGGVKQKPAVVSAPSPNFNDRGGMDIDTIVLHHTATNNGAADLAHMRRASSGVSAHYMVDRDGTIYQLVADSKRAWHAGKSQLHGVPTDVNGRSIGIEIVNDGRGKTPYTEAQYRALEKLVPWLVAEYKVPMKNLVGHKDVAVPKGRKSDPSANFDFQRIRNAVTA